MYDHLNWTFIRNVLREIGIRGRILELLMHCITSVKYQAILNGEVSNIVTPKCGIRQGDPLSPYIFVLCMEKLSHIIQHKVQEKVWRSIQICYHSPFKSHIFFVDDLILSGETFRRP